MARLPFTSYGFTLRPVTDVIAALQKAGLDVVEQRGLDDVAIPHHLLVARRGREPGLRLERSGGAVPLKEWAAALLDELTGVCELLDGGDPARPYGEALLRQRDKLAEPALTPSARLLRELHQAGVGYAEYTRQLSAQHRARLLEPAGHDALALAGFSAEAAESLHEQELQEAADRGSFEEYLARALGPGFA